MAAMDMEMRLLTTVTIADEEARLLTARGATSHLANQYLRGVAEGQQVIIASRWGAGAGDLFLLKLYMGVRFMGNKFIPDSAVPGHYSRHCLDLAEYELRRVRWQRKRDGAVAWMFDVEEILDLWILCTSVEEGISDLRAALLGH